MFDDIFGGMFDFNGDGHTDFLEGATGFAVLNKIMEEENESINQHLQLLLPRQRRSP